LERTLSRFLVWSQQEWWLAAEIHNLRLNPQKRNNLHFFALFVPPASACLLGILLQHSSELDPNQMDIAYRLHAPNATL
jgi:hypothetical protein